ncbi:MFS transporter [Streptomyces sp. NPDC007088]|uniref:MFS transporter n=1 Tax=Streptomyces sp. NPDC007088 TaxID=3364773 RepID=UPI003695B9A8
MSGRGEEAAAPRGAGRSAATSRRRAALFTLFVVNGVVMASWVTRTPAIRDEIGASTAGMGAVIFGLSVGAMIGVLSSGTGVARLGGRRVSAIGVAASCVAPLVLGAGAATGSAPVVFAGLLVFGGGTGLMEIAVNVEGAALEKVLGRPVLPALHGCYSAGTVAGAGLGILLTSLGFPVTWHLWGVALLCVPCAGWAIRQIPAGTGRVEAAARARGRGRESRGPSVWRERRTVLLGLIVLGMALTEGSANDWLPLIMVDGYELNAATGSLVYTLFAASMAAGRFLGEPVLARLGRTVVVRISAALATAGILVVALAPNAVFAACAVVLWGLGASLGFPVTLSAAGDGTDGASAARVGAVATTGYLAFLAGPPSLGLLGEHVGLRPAMLSVAVVALLAGTLAAATAPPRAAREEDGARLPAQDAGRGPAGLAPGVLAPGEPLEREPVSRKRTEP